MYLTKKYKVGSCFNGYKVRW